MNDQQLNAITDHYRAELEQTTKALAQKPDSIILRDYATDLELAVSDWNIIASSSEKNAFPEAAINRRRRNAWSRYHGSANSQSEIERKCHELAQQKLAALDAIKPQTT